MHDLVIKGGTVVDGTGAPGAHGRRRDHRRRRHRGRRGRRASARETIDADGALVTPGFVDVHTHFDGQVTWDPLLTPTCWHGVTTIVMGNCGVGFAPVQPDKHEWLIGLMEGVEDIPGAALSEGIQWGWETFPEYLDAVDARAEDARRRRAGSARRGARLRDGGARREERAGDARTTSRRWPRIVREASRPARSASRRAARSRTWRSTVSPCPARSRPRTSCSASAACSASSAPACSSSRRPARSARTSPRPSARWRGCASSRPRSAGRSRSRSRRTTTTPSRGGACSSCARRPRPRARRCARRSRAGR